MINGEAEVDFFQQNREVWSSTDGINWKKEAVIDPYFTGRGLFETVVFNEQLWIIAGKIGITIGLDDIWVMD